MTLKDLWNLLKIERGIELQTKNNADFVAGIDTPSSSLSLHSKYMSSNYTRGNKYE
jgi:hypothetical protein